MLPDMDGSLVWVDQKANDIEYSNCTKNCDRVVLSLHSLSKSGSAPVGDDFTWGSHTGNQRLPCGALPGFKGKQGRSDSIDFISAVQISL
jgi:hypothetical protein